MPYAREILKVKTEIPGGVWSEKKHLQGFERPTDLPGDEQSARSWQRANRSWWESHPMRYDWRDPVAPAERSPEWYREIDRRFFESSRPYLPWRERPFDLLIPFAELGGKSVLEIGTGMGSHAHLLAGAAGSFIGVDLTDYATRATRRRFDLFGLPGLIARMEGEHLAIRDGSIDFVWTWGVIHHASDTHRVLREIHRVLCPGGRAVVMVYHRSFWFWWVRGLLQGIFCWRLFELGSLHRVVQETTDGALARYYTPAEWRQLCRGMFAVERIRICGNKAELFPLPPGRTKQALLRLVPDSLARWFSNTMRQGSFLVATMQRV